MSCVRKKNKLVFGWGINDADYQVQLYDTLGDTLKRKWICPYYEDWYDIIRRSKSDKLKSERHTYRDVSVCEEWKYFSNFKKWVDSQPNKDWVNCQADKDILCYNKPKIYSPETVVYITESLNQFLKDRGNDRGKYKLGVSKQGNGYVAKCSNPFSNNNEDGRYLGYFSTELEAHLAWKAKKHEYACVWADLQEDVRVSEVLRSIYL